MAEIQELTTNAVQLLHNCRETPLTLNKEIRFSLLKECFPSELNATFYESALCLILQGRKEVITGRRSFSFGAGELLIISHEIPVVSKITEASEATPYIALVLGLDYSILRGLHYEFSGIPFTMDKARSLQVNDAGSQIIDPLFRLLNASQDVTDTIVLLPQILREVHFRLLQAPCGGMLRNLLRDNSHASKISKAISLIRGKYNETLSVAEIARSVGMSASSFFHHFKVITESTPLQYQKNIRLLEARRLLMSEGESVTQTALTVGYESPNQFSREYVRKFGSTPSSDSKTSVSQLLIHKKYKIYRKALTICQEINSNYSPGNVLLTYSGKEAINSANVPALQLTTCRKGFSLDELTNTLASLADAGALLMIITVLAIPACIFSRATLCPPSNTRWRTRDSFNTELFR